MKYKKKPVVIEAFKLGVDNFPDWAIEARNKNELITLLPQDYETESPFEDTSHLIMADIHTLEGVMHADNGDYIIKGVKGEIYPCKPDIFEATYEKVE
ncbi:hypothetical protein CCAL6883_09105 [Campylobacter sp. RM6883]|uniref:hypothetical protein n=1 Tax=Campylobacter californiensis TaxID=1032243 RepID=UPI001451AD72|nr:hypothetical protein [Campylobacter sp. RM6914]MBE2985486.1 hypothetical protein [Campylobacter sp. RM6883]MBE2995895.1 hypothetical protein [Campylobacter sp. RM6913]QCD51216.1 hypothetical protein CCAL_1331 [Campylobacter sp. RM6914]